VEYQICILKGRGVGGILEMHLGEFGNVCGLPEMHLGECGDVGRITEMHLGGWRCR
jgi:hypothetical protein